MVKRFKIQTLREAGIEQARVAELVGVSERSVRRIEAEPPVAIELASVTPQAKRAGRPSAVEPFRGFIETKLRDDPKIMTLEVLRLMRLDGYNGQKSAVYDLVAALRPKETQPIVRFDGLPGEFTQHDFGEVEVRFVNEPKRKVRFFASRLKYSRHAQVTIVPDQTAETLARTVIEHFAAIGGIPLLAVFDRPKTIALEWKKNGEITKWNPIFREMAMDLGLGVEVCWPHSPEQKGSIEALVKWVKGSFFKCRRFLDYDDMLRQLRDWLIEINERRPSSATGVIPKTLFDEERPRLRPLRVQPEAFAVKIPVCVGPMATVVYDTVPYSMPPDAIGISGTLHLFRNAVKIVAGRYSADHPRLSRGSRGSYLPEHRRQSVAAVSGVRGKRYLKRQQILDLGGPALDFLTELTHRKPRLWYNDVDLIHEMMQTYGDRLVRNAMSQALQDGQFGAEYITHHMTAMAGGWQS